MAAFPLVGRGSAQASQNRSFLTPGQGQAARSRPLSSLPAHLPPSPFAPRKTSCTPPLLPLLMTVWPPLSTPLLSHAAPTPSLDAAQYTPKAPEKLFPTVHFPGNGNICASLQASSRASLRSSLTPGEAKCCPRPSGGPGVPLPGRLCLCWVQGGRAWRFLQTAHCSPSLLTRWYLPSQLFCLHFLFCLQCGLFKVQERCVEQQSKNKSCFSFS